MGESWRFLEDEIITICQRQGFHPRKTHGEWHVSLGPIGQTQRFLNLTTFAQALAERGVMVGGKP